MTPTTATAFCLVGGYERLKPGKYRLNKCFFEPFSTSKVSVFGRGNLLKETGDER